MATQSYISLILIMPRVTLQLADIRCPNRDSPPNAVPEHKCLDCGDEMRIVSFIESEQKDVIEKILRRYGLRIERNSADRLTGS